MPTLAHRHVEYAFGTPVKMGIDEAGRGAILGPLVYGAAYWPISEDAECSSLGFDGASLRPRAASAKRQALLRGRSNSNTYGTCARRFLCASLDSW